MEKSLKLTALALFALCLGATGAMAQERQWRVGTSLLGEPKYQEGFAYFDYVNPDAPKGGLGEVFRPPEGSTPSIPSCRSGKPLPAWGWSMRPSRLRSLDEVYSEYGLLAESLSYPDDFSSVTFRINPRARWQDGEPVTPEDVVWSFKKLTELNPSQQNYYANVSSAEVTGEGEVTFTFSEKNNRELPHIMGQLLVLPQHWVGRDGCERAEARHLALDAGAANGFGPLQDGRVQPGQHHRLPACAGLLGAERAGSDRNEQFRSGPLRVLPRPDSSVRGLQGRPVRLVAGKHGTPLGHRLRLSGRCRGFAWSRNCSRTLIAVPASCSVSFPTCG